MDSIASPANPVNGGNRRIRNLLTIRDESDNAEVARVLNPIIALCRHGGKTLLLAHHTRKGGGEHGEAITGGHAFLGVVDVALELTFMDSSGQDGRRRVRGRSRVISIPDLVYERTQDGSFRALGSPSALALAEVEQRLLHVLDDHWQTTSELLAALDDPKPSRRHLLEALASLCAAGLADRDPEQEAPGKTYRFRLKPQPFLDL